MKLYTFYFSSASFRVRIALRLKGLEDDPIFVNLRDGDQFEPGYLPLNPQQQVPTLDDGGVVITQSLAILEYLEEAYPEPALLPATPDERARVRSLALAIACDIHPLNNLRVLKYLTGEMGHDETERDQWYHHWIALGLSGVERILTLTAGTGRFCHGDSPTMADVCLVPQIFNAKRYDCPLQDYPTVMSIFDACMALEAFDAAQPLKQSDAPKDR
ncbi:MAG: maleylacetoacetate isomerase [Alphaproteobacteria bacterium]|nr:maleylacetoacetate isomerase [Alphaproteobacteria bacterium]